MIKTELPVVKKCDYTSRLIGITSLIDHNVVIHSLHHSVEGPASNKV